MAFKTPLANDVVPNSPEGVLLTLPRRKIAGVLLHQGEMMRNYVAEALQEPDVALQLPTGSGKTLVGLLIAEWRRRKFNERVVYLCPTNQLVHQVAEQANEQYGLNVSAFVGAKRDYSAALKADYQNAARVAVTNYSSLFNVNPFFSNPDIVILDDAHAAENYIANHWTLRISRLEHAALHAALLGVLNAFIEPYDYARLSGRWENERNWVDKLPTPSFLAVAEDVTAVLDEHADHGDLGYRWSALRDRLSACHMYLSAGEIMIRPLIPPTAYFAPFASAKQRIYMSATLGSGGDLERTTGRKSIKRLAVPEGWDQQGIGRRFFIFPSYAVEEDKIPGLATDLMKQGGRSLVLVPSDRDAREVKELVSKQLGFPIFSADDIELSKRPFVETPEAVAIVANRYDGIDFPHDDCRLLFIDGQPTAANLQERFVVERMGGEQLLEDRLQTRVLQAIGRCTRSLRDYSAVVIAGEDLVDYLSDSRRMQHFHPELQAELWFGLDQSRQGSADDFRENMRIFLENGADWEAANNLILNRRGSLVQQPLPAMDELEAAAKLEIDYQARMWGKDYEGALEAAEAILGVLKASELRGYRALWHYLAGSSAWLSAEAMSGAGANGMRARSREQFRASMRAAVDLPWLSKLARFDEAGTAPPVANASLLKQIERVESKLRSLGTQNDRGFARVEKQILEGLYDHTSFEYAQVLLGELLGFDAGNEETDAAPDPWWIADDICIVFEDYVGNQGGPLGAEKARQAASHPNWIRSKFAHASEMDILPVLVTPATTARTGAEPHLGTVAYWPANDYREWAKRALIVLRQLRPLISKGPLLWRMEAATLFEQNYMGAHALAQRLKQQMCSTAMTIVG